MKRLFLVAGELSGDQLGAWYLQKRLQTSAVTYDIQAIGGDCLEKSGARLYQHFTTLNVVGIVEIIQHIPRLLKVMNNLVDYLVAQQVDEVVLVDFPGFNLRLAKKLKAKNKSLKITYLSPPQVWCWGRWRLATLKKYIDEVVVIYPFEVSFYAQHCIKASWLGNPVYDRLAKYFPASVSVMPTVALLPGSRMSEVATLLPIMAAVAQKLIEKNPEVMFVLPRPSSISREVIAQQLSVFGLENHVHILEGEDEKIQALRSCYFAITKPGTVTLELALLTVPAMVMYKTSPITYALAKCFVYISWMSLPNLLSGQELYPEFLQGRCNVDLLFEQAQTLYEQAATRSLAFMQKKEKLTAVRDLFLQKNF